MMSRGALVRLASCCFISTVIRPLQQSVQLTDKAFRKRASLKGGMIAFNKVDGKIGVEINTAAAKHAGLNFSDTRPAEEILAALSADPHLGAAIIFDAEGKPFVRYVRPGWKIRPAAALETDCSVFRPEHLEVLHPVMLNGSRLGTVLLQ